MFSTCKFWSGEANLGSVIHKIDHLKGTVNRGKVSTCSIVKNDVGEHKGARYTYIDGNGKSEPGISRDYCISMPYARIPAFLEYERQNRKSCR